MLTRFKWFKVRFSKRVPNIGKILLDCRLTRGSDFGFQRADSAEKTIYRFLWRTSVSVRTVDARGNPGFVTVPGVDAAEFSLTPQSTFYILRLQGLRDLSRLLDAFELATDSIPTVSVIEVTPGDAADVLRGTDTAKLIGLKVSGATISQKVVARLEFASREGMSETDLTLLQGLKYKIDLATYEATYNGISGRASFSSSGSVRIGGKLAPALLDALERKICEIATR